MYLKENKSSTPNKSLKSNTSKAEKAIIRNSSFEKIPVIKTLNNNVSMNTLDSNNSEIIQKKGVNTNSTGIPDSIKTYFENKSGLSFNDVRVHYNSDKPQKLNALAYTQNNHVYIKSGQERHLSHELGHVIQQRQGRVKSTIKMNGMAVNDDKRLEQEADKSSNIVTSYHGELLQKNALHYAKQGESNVIQLLTYAEIIQLDNTTKVNAQKAFGEKYGPILSIVPNVETLKSWTDTANALLQNANFPPLGMTKKAGLDKYDAYIKTLLPTEDKSSIPIVRIIPTTSIPASSISEPSYPKFADFIESIQKVNLDYNEHGNCGDISRKNIIKKIKDYKESVYFVETLENNDLKYKLDLEKDWCIIILISKDLSTACICHFGPFGILTTVELDAKAAAHK